MIKLTDLMKGHGKFEQGVVYSNPYHTAFKPQVKEEVIEEATAKFDFTQVGGIAFYVSSPNKNIVLLPQSRKEIEKIDTIIDKSSKEEFIKSLQIRLEKKLGISLEQDRRHAGAGYAFDIDTDKLFNKL
jgi:hypothetical protein